MFSVSEYFKFVDNFMFPELFEKKLNGFDDLEQIWDILKRIHRGFVAQKVKPQILGVVEEGAILKGEDIYVGKNTKIQAGAMIIGPAIIGANAEIRHGAYIRGHVIVADGAIVGHSSEVIRSVLLPGAKAPHFNYVGDSILGTKVNLGAGTKLSNLKNDVSEVLVKVGNETYETHLKKFGAILGDNCMIGCNAVTNPGTIMGRNCRVYPNSTVSGVHSKNAIIKLRQNIEMGTVSED
ncbi:MAG: glucose-1-phosphate thymidylyltransferase [Candidatus Riflebacteria bacterium]|nr:glucose-1-phosphate thymidylyltransferase [Candidatus Riflebacteria bacterium]